MRVYEKSLEMIRAVTRLNQCMRRFDRDLANQLQRAATSVALNLQEGLHSRGGNRTARLEQAYASAKECRACLRVANAAEYLNEEATCATDAMLDEIGAMLWVLMRRMPRAA